VQEVKPVPRFYAVLTVRLPVLCSTAWFPIDNPVAGDYEMEDISMLRKKLFTLVTILALFGLTIGSGGVAAQDVQPPAGESAPYPSDHDRTRDLDKSQGLPAAGHPERKTVSSPSNGIISSPQNTGGPDDFGYTWDDTVAFSWIDAVPGTDTGMSGDSAYQHVGPIVLPFSFKYYENTYDQVWIGGSGYMGFTSFTDNNPDDIPSPSSPNNGIAPYWASFQLAENGPANRVYYTTGGIAPNRYFVAEWYQVTYSGDYPFTFEAVLYENGDILFQYQAMADTINCKSVGIEDSTGTDGLTYIPYACFLASPPDNTAMRFTRPASSARLRITPRYYGQFTHPGDWPQYYIPVQNKGDIGTDTYDLVAISGWPVHLLADEMGNPLTDTDSDGVVDTGPVAQGAGTGFYVQVDTPITAMVGDDNTVILTATSSLNTAINITATLQASVPAPFAQVFSDSADDAMRLALIQPAFKAEKRVTIDDSDPSYQSVTEAPNGNFIYAWASGPCFDDSCDSYGYEIVYAVLDRTGNTVRGVSKLTDHGGATAPIYDFSPSLDVTPDGRVGIVWNQRRYNDLGQWNSNVFFAALDSATGNVLAPPNTITNNDIWATTVCNVPAFFDPHLAATGDNRFILTWTREICEDNGWVTYIYYGVRDGYGGMVKENTPLTASGWDSYSNLTTLSGNRALLSWEGYSGNGGEIYFAVLDSAGSIVKNTTSAVSYDAWGEGGTDAVQLSGGNSVLAWSGWPPLIKYIVLDADYNLTAGPFALANPALIGGNYQLQVSVAADDSDHAILTWMEPYGYSLFYALVDSNGATVTQPMIFATRENTDSSLSTGYFGEGNTSYSWIPSSGMDVYIQSTALVGAPPGSVACIPIAYGNTGTASALSVIITTTLAASLTYLSDTSGVTPTINGNQITWVLPGLDFLDTEPFTLRVSLPDVPIGASYPVGLEISPAGVDANPIDNIFDLQVMAVIEIYQPLVLRTSP
jgi:hypothetical protein